MGFNLHSTCSWLECLNVTMAAYGETSDTYAWHPETTISRRLHVPNICFPTASFNSGRSEWDCKLTGVQQAVSFQHHVGVAEPPNAQPSVGYARLTSQPRPQAPSAGDSQLSSTNRTSCSPVSIPNASKLPKYSSWALPGSGLRTTCMRCAGQALGIASRHPSTQNKEARYFVWNQLVSLILLLPKDYQCRTTTSCALCVDENTGV